MAALPQAFFRAYVADMWPGAWRRYLLPSQHRYAEYLCKLLHQVSSQHLGLFTFPGGG